MRGKKQFYNEFWALKDVTFDVQKGETVGIIGRNGSGKSTLLQLICGTLNPTAGSIHTKGRVAAILELGSGFNPEFTGRENVYMNGALLGLSKEEIDDRFNSIAEFADIGEFIDQPVKSYSSGMVVRLAFAVVINVDPKILVIDEALSVGDELFQRKCFSHIESIKNSGATILFVSHSGSTVVELCDHAILLESGKKLTMGSPKNIIGKYQRLIYAPQDKRALIIKEIIASDECIQNNRSIPTSNSSTEKPREKQSIVESSSEEILDPNLKAQSTLEYESRGACIVCPEILTMFGKSVNYLKRGRNYRYAYRVRFDKGATNVRFGMLIKTISGLELGGAVSAPSIGRGISYIGPGTTVNVEFRFVCNLNPGTYYLNAGVQGASGDEDTYLHRILDIFMFKVMPIADDTATAVIDFKCTTEINPM